MFRLVDATESEAGRRVDVRPADKPARGGRDRAVDELLQTHLPHVYRFALQFLGDHHLAEDVAHDCMLRAWRHRRKLREPRAGRVWLLRIAANLCRDLVRRRKHRVAKAASLETDPPERTRREANAEANLQHREDLVRVLEEMARLSPKRRRVLFLHAFEQLSHEEIAEVLRMSKASVMSTLSQARAILRERLSDIDPVPSPLPGDGRGSG